MRLFLLKVLISLMLQKILQNKWKINKINLIKINKINFVKINKIIKDVEDEVSDEIRNCFENIYENVINKLYSININEIV